MARKLGRSMLKYYFDCPREFSSIAKNSIAGRLGRCLCERFGRLYLLFDYEAKSVVEMFSLGWVEKFENGGVNCLLRRRRW
ncbi:hypothetical protein MTR_3g102340 [Medicago truncatula]|uniref:Uncharacterized protein n=1 Tax=Medicago truncatula TaxID=3880 RepID=G7J702_MEDTR|nr:hypothetical protein MTR_3g102340 [Medicago truncatula]